MPRPQRCKVAPSAPAQLPESLMKAIRANKESKKREEQNEVQRRTSSRINRKVSPQEYLMSGALRVRDMSENDLTDTDEKRKQHNSSPIASTVEAEHEIIPSSITSNDPQLASPTSPLEPPTTIQRPTFMRSAMPSANWRTQATPRVDSSAIGNFKRRPRQPSILGIGRQDDSSVLSSLGGGDHDTFIDNLENFEPTIETPLMISKTRHCAQPTTIPEPSLPSSSGARKRKRGIKEDLDILVRRTPSNTVDEPIEFRGSSPEPSHDESSDIVLPVLKDTASSMSQTSEKSSSHTGKSIMRPPDSSPVGTNDDNIPQASLRAQQQGATKQTQSSPSKSLPQTRARKSRALQPISTAQLQNLLPSRRSKPKSKSDASLDTINLNSDDESERSFQPTKCGRGKSKQPKSPVKKIVASKSRTKATLQDKTNTKSASTSTTNTRQTYAKSATTRKPASTSKTYGRVGRAASGQENTAMYSLPSTQEQPEDASDATAADLNVDAKNTLKAIAQKFAEVDEWEMEFEEVDSSSGSGIGLVSG